MRSERAQKEVEEIEAEVEKTTAIQAQLKLWEIVHPS